MTQTASRPRILWIDTARTVALLAMAVYHTGFDLELFGRIPPGTMMEPGWRLFARLIAGTFIALAGVGLYLSHGQGIRWGAFWRRFARIAGAALLVTLGTTYLLGPEYIFFGILHSIALSSLVGLLFLRMPVPVTLAAAVLALILPRLVAGHLDLPWLIWTGLTTFPVYAVDFVPPFPWLAPFLAGLALAKALGPGHPLFRPRPQTPASRILGFPGRHSLAFYLIHQLVLFPLVYGLSWLGLI